MLKPSPLVGREVERAGLDAALERCRDGRGGLILVSGDCGVGKSRLVSEVLATWDGCLLRGTASVGAAAYAPIAEVLEGAADELGRSGPPEGLRLLPERASDGEVDQTELQSAVRRQLREVARKRPTVVLLEDLHRADAAALDLLPTLATSAEQASLLVLGCYDSNELPRAHPIRGVRAELRRQGHLHETVLGPLTADETGRMLAGGLGQDAEPDLVAAVHARTGGLPFFIEEIAAALRESSELSIRDGKVGVPQGAELPLPDSVVEAVAARTRDIREAHPDAVELAAVLGVHVDLPALAELVAPPDIDRLLDAGLLEEHPGDRAMFRHALVRDSIYSTIPWARRRELHRRVGDVLTSRETPPEPVAEHWMAAHEHERARPLLLAAAERSCALHAYRDAARQVRRALSIWPADHDPQGRLGTLERLAECAELSADLESAVMVWSEVAAEHGALGDRHRVGLAQRRLANAAELRGDLAGAAIAREGAVAAFIDTGARADAAAERLALAEQLASAAHLRRALDHAVAATEDAEAASRTDLRARALALQGSIRASLGDLTGVELARSALDLAFAGQLTEEAGLTYYELATALLHAADYGASADAYASAFEFCREHEMAGLDSACLACMSVAVRFKGDWDHALSICAGVLGNDDVPEKIKMVALEESSLITALRGDHRRARGPLRRAEHFGRSHGVFGIEVGATWGLAMVADLAGDPEAATATITEMLERCAVREDWNFALPALRWSATYVAERGEHDLLGRCHRLLGAAATQNIAPKVLSVLAHVGGELMLADGDAAGAAAQFGRSVDLLQGQPTPFEEALAQLRWGVALAGHGERKDAVDSVTRAYRTARQLGARPLARQCASSLADMGEQVDRRLGRLAARSLDPAGLTRRETEVLRMLTLGRTNREIAETLFVSTRTVDMHVRNLFVKLDCTSRVGATRRATELGLLEDAGPTKSRQ